MDHHSITRKTRESLYAKSILLLFKFLATHGFWHVPEAIRFWLYLLCVLCRCIRNVCWIADSSQRRIVHVWNFGFQAVGLHWFLQSPVHFSGLRGEKWISILPKIMTANDSPVYILWTQNAAKWMIVHVTTKMAKYHCKVVRIGLPARSSKLNAYSNARVSVLETCYIV